MDGSMADEKDRFISIGDGSPLASGSLARIDLDPDTYWVLYQASKDLRRDAREHLLARITPGELVYIEHMCRHPEQTNEQAITALGLRESAVLAYYAHLDRNFSVRNSSELRRWAFENRLVPTPDDGPEEDVQIPVDGLDEDVSMSDDGPEEDGPDKGFDPGFWSF